jgi:hypothetical protein
LRQDLDGRAGTESAAYALLNLGLCAMHFGDLIAAHEHFIKATHALPVRSGLSRGTAFYYLGVVLERMGFSKEAADAFGSAASFEGATVYDNDGPLIKALVPSSFEG